MRVLFLQEKAIDESLALCDAASWLASHGHDVHLLLDREERDLWGEATRWRPDVVLLPASVVNHTWTRQMSRAVREHLGVPTVATGTAPTLHPEGLRLSGLDYLVRGEAERPLAGLLSMLEEGRDPCDVPGVWAWEGDRLRGTDADAPLDTLPTPDRGLYFDRYPWFGRFPWKKFTGSRGCFHRCTYCYIPTLNTIPPKMPGIRRKAPEALVEEVVREARRAPLHHVHFSDDIFTDDAAWLEEFAVAYRRRVGVPFTGNTSAELVTDRVAAALAEAGCHAMGFAVESGNEEMRLKVLKKGVPLTMLHRAADALRNHGVRIATFNMIALPGETPDMAFETAQLNADLGTDFIRLNFAFPMPGSAMCDYALANGYLDADWPDRFASDDFDYRPRPWFRGPHREEFQRLFVLFRLAARVPSSLPWVRRMVRSGTPFRRLLGLQGLWVEKRQFRLPIVPSVGLLLRTGRPEYRASNFPSLV